MKLNDIICMNYSIGTDTAVITLASTDMDALKALGGRSDLMLYDGSDNPLISLAGFDRLISVRVMLDSNVSEVTFGHSDSRIAELEQTAEELRAEVKSLKTKNTAIEGKVNTLQKANDTLTGKIAALESASVVEPPKESEEITQ